MKRVVVALLRAQTKPRRNATRRNRPQSWSKQLSRLRRGIGVRMSVGVGMDVDVDVEHDFQGCGKVPLLTAKSMQCKSSAAAKSHLLWSENPKRARPGGGRATPHSLPCLRSSACHIHWGQRLVAQLTPCQLRPTDRSSVMHQRRRHRCNA
jgi:hypothetical protein